MGGSALSHSMSETSGACFGKGKGAGRGEGLLEVTKPNKQTGKKRTNLKKLLFRGRKKKRAGRWKGGRSPDSVLKRNSPGFTSVTIKQSLVEKY